MSQAVPVHYQELLSTNPSLLRRLHQHPNSPDAWAELVRRYGPHIYRWCKHWGVPSADVADVTQDVLLRLVRRMSEFRYDEGGSFRAYLKSLVRYAWYDFQQQQRDPAVTARAGLEELSGIAAREDLERRLEEEFDRELLAEAMLRVVQRVLPLTWEAFRLQAVQGMPAAKVAEQLGMKIAAVYKARSNVTRMLQETVQALGEEGLTPEASHE